MPPAGLSVSSPNAPSSVDDASLVARCLDGRADGWGALVDRYARLVRSIPRRYGLDDADADDVAQATFIQLHRSLDRLRDAERLSSWLITTAHRESWRIGRRRPELSDHLHETIADVGTPDPAEAARWEREQAVRRALGELGGRCEALLTRLFRDPSPDYTGIARDLGMPVGSIGPTRARCFQKLAPILRRLGLAPDGSEAPGEADASH
jgi:RNA polymerase sigma factor (sigma-70 family)